MNEQGEAKRQFVGVLDPAARMSDTDWPGVVAKLATGWRLAVNAKGTRYALQKRGRFEGREIWAGSSYATLTALRAKADVEGLAEACDGLPDRPAGVLPELEQGRSALLQLFAATDWAADGYPRVAWQCGNYRVIVTPCGTIYRGQWARFFKAGEDVSISSKWQSRWITASKTELARLFAWNAIGFRGAEGLSPVSVFLREFEGLPELAADGQWPVMPERPKARQKPSKAAHSRAQARAGADRRKRGQAKP